MCGIAGLVYTDRSHPVDVELLEGMTRSMAHRGPDAGTTRAWAGAALGHRRLSIIDLVTGDQPVVNEDGSVAVVLNGEIYNFRELRGELQARGHRFTTRSDTEAIAHGWEEWGPGCVERLHGMFALAVWDTRARRLLLARDRAGKKPLYYVHDGERLAFASELKALLHDPALKREVEAQSLDDYFALGAVQAPRTIFKNVHQLAPAHRLLWDNGHVHIEEYWDVPIGAAEAMDEGAALEEFTALFDDAVRRRLVSDVPLGAFLSGGVDSSAVVASMARELGDPVVTTSIGFDETAYDELPHARTVARHLGTDHHEMVVRADAAEVLPRLVWHLDEPFADSSALPAYYVARATRDRVTVALSGDGGDELFAGYQRRYGLNRLESRLRGVLSEPVRRRIIRPLGRVYPKADWLPRPLRARYVLQNLGTSFERAYFADLSIFRDDERAWLLTPEFQRAVAGHDAFAAFARHFDRVRDVDPLSRLLYVDLKTWLANDILVKVDRMSMAVSLEVRAPLLDHRVIEFAARVPSVLKFRGRTSKYLLKRHLEARVPASVIHRPKQGFEVPVGAWLRGPLREMAADLLLSARARQRGIVDARRVGTLWHRHQSGMHDHASQLWTLLVLELWHRTFVDRDPRDGALR